MEVEVVSVTPEVYSTDGDPTPRTDSSNGKEQTAAQCSALWTGFKRFLGTIYDHTHLGKKVTTILMPKATQLIDGI